MTSETFAIECAAPVLAPARSVPNGPQGLAGDDEERALVTVWLPRCTPLRSIRCRYSRQMLVHTLIHTWKTSATTRLTGGLVICKVWWNIIICNNWSMGGRAVGGGGRSRGKAKKQEQWSAALRLTVMRMPIRRHKAVPPTSANRVGAPFSVL